MVFEGDKLSRKSLELNCEASHCSNYTLINKQISNKESCLIFGINDQEETDIGFIKINIKGEEENMIKDVLTFSSKNKIPVYISFYVDLWEDKNIKRFNDLFDVLRIKYKNRIINLEKFYNMLTENQEESFLVKKTISKFITAICEKDYSLADTLLKEILTEKIKSIFTKLQGLYIAIGLPHKLVLIYPDSP
jgi:hypothetical protein